MIVRGERGWPWGGELGGLGVHLRGNRRLAWGGGEEAATYGRWV